MPDAPATRTSPTHSPVYELKWLTAGDLAFILGLARQTIYNKLQTCPASLPPPTRVPNLRGPRWSQQASLPPPTRVPNLRGPRWSQQAVREFQARFDPPGIREAPPQRGRPTKADQIARRALSAEA